MIKRQFFEMTTKTVWWMLQRYKEGSLLPSLYEQFIPTYKVVNNVGNEFIFYTPNALTRWRGETLFEKEPETIKWIDSFDEDDVFYDIGANVGVYSIYAGVAKSSVRVFSFEPTFVNYGILNRNIYLNKLGNRVSAICIALSNKNSFDYIYMPEVKDGCALVNFGDNLDCNKKKFVTTFKQGTIAYSLDSFINQFTLPFPNHIKIDVDGLEREIVLGAIETLKNSKLKTLLIELNEKIQEDLDLINLIIECGFRLQEKRHAEMFDNSKYKDIYNYIFIKSKKV